MGSPRIKSFHIRRAFALFVTRLHVAGMRRVGLTDRQIAQEDEGALALIRKSYVQNFNG